jgi:antitoxin VapB
MAVARIFNQTHQIFAADFSVTYAEYMPRRKHPEPATVRHVQLFRNGRHQVVRIPSDLEMPGTEALMRKEGNRLILEPITRPSLAALLDSWTDIDTDWPDIPDHPPRPVKLTE